MHLLQKCSKTYCGGKNALNPTMNAKSSKSYSGSKNALNHTIATENALIPTTEAKML